MTALAAGLRFFYKGMDFKVTCDILPLPTVQLDQDSYYDMTSMSIRYDL